MGTGLLVEQGIVASLEHPGGNITGVESHPLGLSGKRLEILKEAVPQISRVAFLFDSTNPFWKIEGPGLETDARALDLQLQHVPVRHPGEFDAAFAAIVESHTDALFIADEGMFYPYFRQIMNFAATHRLPTVSGNRRFAEAGSLIAYGYNLRELAQRAAVYVDKILKGARPGDLPIERAMKFELIINLTTAQALGLTLSPVFLFRADEVIK
jgi:putative ABC transport system substrate-binding protein